MDGSSMDYLMNAEDQSMAFQLARNGFDVWLLNNRGNYYSFESKNTTADKSDFWAFGPEDMGTKDLPAAIDYILQNTKEKTVTIVGMDQGS
jgi:predicted alpha/beta hydrolase